MHPIKTTLTLGKSIIQHLALGNRLIASALRRPAQTESDPEKDEASYPLTVFHRHLTALEPLRGNLLDADVLEIGPGSNLGFGLLVLLAGANSIICLSCKFLAHRSSSLTATVPEPAFCAEVSCERPSDARVPATLYALRGGHPSTTSGKSGAWVNARWGSGMARLRRGA